MINHRVIVAFALAGATLALTGCPSTTKTQANLTLSASPYRIDNQGQTTQITVSAQDASGAAGTGSVTITAAAGAFDNGTKTATLTLANGQASVGYQCNQANDSGCTGTVRLSATWNSATATYGIQVGPQDAGTTGTDAGGGGTDAGGGGGGDAGVTVGPPATIGWLSTTCNGQPCPVMGVQTSGVNELAQVSFYVVDSNNNPVPNVTVTFNLTTPPTGTALIALTGTTDTGGHVSAQVHSGPAIGEFVVHAVVKTGIEAFSPTIGVRGAKPSNQGFTLSCLPVNIPAYHSPNPSPQLISVTCKVIVVDRFNNRVGNAVVNFKTEAGSIAASVTTTPYTPGGDNTQEGTASVTFSTAGAWPLDVAPLPAVAGQYLYDRSAEPFYDAGITHNPRDGLVTVMAFVRGEEYFTDNNANGVWDPGEPFIDQGQPFVDSNDNNTWDPGEIFVEDVSNPDGGYHAGNGIWDSNTTIWTEARILYTSLPNISVSVPGNWQPCPNGIDAGTVATAAVYISDQNLNRPCAGTTVALGGTYGTSPTGLVPPQLRNTLPLQDSFGFGWDRLLVDASTGNSQCVLSGSSGITPICNWKTVFYGWNNPFYSSMDVPYVTAGPQCVSETTQITDTTDGTVVGAYTPYLGLR